MRNRFLCTLLCISLILSAFTMIGCNKEKAPKEEKTTTSEAPKDKETEDKKPADESTEKTEDLHADGDLIISNAENLGQFSIEMMQGKQKDGRKVTIIGKVSILSTAEEPEICIDLKEGGQHSTTFFVDDIDDHPELKDKLSERDAELTITGTVVKTDKEDNPCELHVKAADIEFAK